MKQLKQSRGPDIDIEKIIENSGGNRYSLIHSASKRVYELRRGSEPLIKDHVILLILE